MSFALNEKEASTPDRLCMKYTDITEYGVGTKILKTIVLITKGLITKGLSSSIKRHNEKKGLKK